MGIDQFNLYISTILHNVAQWLMVPVMLVLLGLIVFALYCVGSIIAEVYTERRHFKANIPQVINEIHDADFDKVEEVVTNSALLKPQKAALIMAVRNMGLTDDDLFALAKTEIAKVDDRYKRILSKTEQVTKIAPMMGLMCTLIPLGPGIVAMGRGDVTLLSQSLLIAFDGTVAGLLAAVVALLVTAIRKRWYNQYLLVLESLMTTVLDKAGQARSEGIALPHDYYDSITFAVPKPAKALLVEDGQVEDDQMEGGQMEGGQVEGAEQSDTAQQEGDQLGAEDAEQESGQPVDGTTAPEGEQPEEPVSKDVKLQNAKPQDDESEAVLDKVAKATKKQKKDAKEPAK